MQRVIWAPIVDTYTSPLYTISASSWPWWLSFYSTRQRKKCLRKDDCNVTTWLSHFHSPHKPVLKFLIVKSVIFLAFWQVWSPFKSLFQHVSLQGIGLAIAESLGAFKNEHQAQPGELSSAFQNFLICIEMFFVSLFHLKAFAVGPFMKTDNVDVSSRVYTFTRVSSNLSSVITTLQSATCSCLKALSPRDLVADTIRNFSSKYRQYHHHQVGLYWKLHLPSRFW